VIEAVEAVTHFRSEMKLLPTPGFGEFGSYAQYHVAEESIVAVKPINLTHVGSLLAVGRNRLGLPYNQRKFTSETVLIHAGAGGVGSIRNSTSESNGCLYIYDMQCRKL